MIWYRKRKEVGKMMNDMTILDITQIYGNNQLAFFKRQLTNASITDFALLLGGFSPNYNYCDNKFVNRQGLYWTKTKIDDNLVYGIDYRSVIAHYNVDDFRIGCRPVLPYSLIQEKAKNKSRTTVEASLEEDLERIEVEYGEYPQFVMNYLETGKLNQLFYSGSLNTTGKLYTIADRREKGSKERFEPEILEEYEYKGKKYVPIRIAHNLCYPKIFLSNGIRSGVGDVVWLRVSPIKWLVDTENDLAVSKNILFAGVPFLYQKKYTGDLYWYLNNIFMKDIIPSKTEAITLTPEKRNFVVSESNFTYQPGVNITMTLPLTNAALLELLQKNDTLTLQSSDQTPIQKVIRFQ